MKYYFCDVYETETPCIFNEYSIRKLWDKYNGNIPRCIKHGSLICNEAEATSKKELHRDIKEANGR